MFREWKPNFFLLLLSWLWRNFIIYFKIKNLNIFSNIFSKIFISTRDVFVCFFGSLISVSQIFHIIKNVPWLQKRLRNHCRKWSKIQIFFFDIILLYETTTKVRKNMEGQNSEETSPRERVAAIQLQAGTTGPRNWLEILIRWRGLFARWDRPEESTKARSFKNCKRASCPLLLGTARLAQYVIVKVDPRRSRTTVKFRGGNRIYSASKTKGNRAPTMTSDFLDINYCRMFSSFLFLLF